MVRPSLTWDAHAILTGAFFHTMVKKEEDDEVEERLCMCIQEKKRSQLQ
jgi:hypothetical protein